MSGLTALSAWWAKLRVGRERIDSGRPQQNDRHERFHRTLMEAIRPACQDRVEQERRFETLRRDYNEEHPREASVLQKGHMP